MEVAEIWTTPRPFLGHWRGPIVGEDTSKCTGTCWSPTLVRTSEPKHSTHLFRLCICRTMYIGQVKLLQPWTYRVYLPAGSRVRATGWLVLLVWLSSWGTADSMHKAECVGWNVAWCWRFTRPTCVCRFDIARITFQSYDAIYCRVSIPYIECFMWRCLLMQILIVRVRWECFLQLSILLSTFKKYGQNIDSCIHPPYVGGQCGPGELCWTFDGVHHVVTHCFMAGLILWPTTFPQSVVVVVHCGR